MNALRVVCVLAFLAPGVFGKPGEVEYFQPFQYGEVRRVTCSNGHGSHTDGGNRYAMDYGMPIGTPVVAAADGVVVATENRFSGPSSDAGRVNLAACVAPEEVRRDLEHHIAMLRQR